MYDYEKEMQLGDFDQIIKERAKQMYDYEKEMQLGDIEQKKKKINEYYGYPHIEPVKTCTHRLPCGMCILLGKDCPKYMPEQEKIQ